MDKLRIIVVHCKRGCSVAELEEMQTYLMEVVSVKKMSLKSDRTTYI